MTITSEIELCTTILLSVLGMMLRPKYGMCLKTVVDLVNSANL